MKCDKAQLGKWGEKTAKEYLAAKGYAIIAENWRMKHYELDLVAQEGNELIFVEVKTRQSEDDDPIDAVNKGKRSRMIASADVFINQVMRGDIAYEYRFDIVGITGVPESYAIEHITDAFFPALAHGI